MTNENRHQASEPTSKKWGPISAVVAATASLFALLLMVTWGVQAQGGNLLYLPAIQVPAAFGPQEVGGSFTRATDIEHAGDERLFVTEQEGVVNILHPDGRQTIFLDLRDRVVVEGAEQGLLAIVFDPDYETNGYFYVTYTAENPSVNDWYLHLSRFSVTNNPDVADPTSEKVLYRLGQDFTEHNGGGMAFNPMDGLLYVGLGDDSQFLEAQNNSNRKGKIVTFEIENGETPGNNVYAKGLRNPWRFAIDEKNGNMFIGDVGDLEWEEIDVIPYTSEERLNFGWPCVEGPEIRFDDGACRHPEQYRLPDYYYKHEDGRCAVIGGEIYRRDTSDPATFLFGDFCSREVWALQFDSTGTAQVEKLGDLDLDAPLNTFGKGIDGTIYVGMHGANMPLYKLIIP